MKLYESFLFFHLSYNIYIPIENLTLTRVLWKQAVIIVKMVINIIIQMSGFIRN